MRYAEVLARLRKESGYTQQSVAEYISKHSGKAYSFGNISSWETGKAEPSLESFLLLCELYSVGDIQGTFRETHLDYRGMTKLNALGRSRVEEYIAMLSNNPIFAEKDDEEDSIKCEMRHIKLYDVPVAAGIGSYLDSDLYEEIEVDATVPKAADYAVRVSGDSMMPRFMDGQIVFIKEQEVLEVGEIGIFEHLGNAYIKMLGHGELVSLNPQYDPIPIGEFDSLHIFGKVVG